MPAVVALPPTSVK